MHPCGSQGRCSASRPRTAQLPVVVLGRLPFGQVEQHGGDPAVQHRAPRSGPSLANSELMCFSTARSDRPSAAATAALFLPSGDLAEHVELSGRQEAQGRRASGRDRLVTSTSTTFGSITDPPAATLRTAPASWAGSDTRSFSR